MRFPSSTPPCSYRLSEHPVNNSENPALLRPSIIRSIMQSRVTHMLRRCPTCQWMRYRFVRVPKRPLLFGGPTQHFLRSPPECSRVGALYIRIMRVACLASLLPPHVSTASITLSLGTSTPTPYADFTPRLHGDGDHCEWKTSINRYCPIQQEQQPIKGYIL